MLRVLLLALLQVLLCAILKEGKEPLYLNIVRLVAAPISGVGTYSIVKVARVACDCDC